MQRQEVWTAAAQARPPQPNGSRTGRPSARPRRRGAASGAPPAAAAGTGSKVEGSVARLAFEAGGCRAVQHALQEAHSQEEAAELARELRGHVREAVESPHANHVLQKIVELLPSELRSFIPQELRGAGAAASRHRYGCRVVCRLLEHQPGADAAASLPPCLVPPPRGGPAVMEEEGLVEEVVAAAPQLIRHEFGRHVVAAVLEHGSAAHRARVAGTLRGNLLSNAMNRSASYVVEQALEHCCDEDRDSLVEQLLGHPDGLSALARGQAGSHVVRSLLKPAFGCRSHVLAELRRLSPELQASKYGKSLLTELGILG